MWVAGNWQNASRYGRDKAKRQDCSGRDVVLLPHKHRLVFSLSRNGIRGSKSAMVCQSARRMHGPNQSKKTVVGSWVNCSSSASLTCGWRIVISPMIPRDFPSLLRFCDGQSDRSFHNRAPVAAPGAPQPSCTRKLLVLKKWSGRVDLNHRPPGPE